MSGVLISLFFKFMVLSESHGTIFFLSEAHAFVSVIKTSPYNRIIKQWNTNHCTTGETLKETSACGQEGSITGVIADLYDEMFFYT